MFPILPEEFFTDGGMKSDEYLERTSTHCDAAGSSEEQYFKGVWRNKPDKEKGEWEIRLKLETKADAVFGEISLSEDSGEFYSLDHIHLIGSDLKFTFAVNGKRNRFLEGQVHIDNDRMHVTLNGIENHYGNYLLLKDNQDQ
jgi:hypothetical protein